MVEGVISATRGYGGDVLGYDARPTAAAVTGRKVAEYSRTMRFLGPQYELKGATLKCVTENKGTEDVKIEINDDAIAARARIAAEVNSQIENIGARRLQTVMEKLLEEVSFEAEDRKGETLVIDATYVDSQLASIARDTDLSKYIL